MNQTNILFNKANIQQWKRDLTDPEFPKFNMDFEIIPHATRKWEGDAGLFLAYRHADRHDLIDWMRGKTSQSVIAEYTGIPIKDAHAMLNPPVDMEYSKITASDFVGVLNLYLETNMVSWPGWYKIKAERDKERAAKRAEKLAAKEHEHENDG